MCGILGVIGKSIDIQHCLHKLKARGPEGNSVHSDTNYQFGFTRLALNGLDESGMQPMKYGDITWVCNGEIYNWREIADEILYTNKSGSDCEIIGPLLKRYEYADMFRRIHGVFAMIISHGDTIIVGRDPYGVRPLFISTSEDRIILSSELKALPSIEFSTVQHFPPGHYAIINKQTLAITYYSYHIQYISAIPRSSVFSTIRESLITAVRRRMLTERPVAALLSGGLDSSLIASIVQKELKIPLETFSIGFQGSEDLRHARMVADHIGSKHTEIIMTPEEFFNVIPQVIHDIESYDITTVRASVGNWLIAREISRRSNAKVVFNGDGADELLGGYLYFFKSPNETEFEEESDRLLQDIHMYDVLRSDRCISSHGLEPRTPFLDKDFVDAVKSIPVHMRRPTKNQVEKWVLREAFKDTNLLPEAVLYRKKEAFSDGVSTHQGISWYQECQTRSFQKVPDWKDVILDNVHLKPYTAESYYYRSLFNTYYPEYSHIIPYFWMPKWSPETNDPSAKTLNQ
uniref:asparagine synthase (glutamine-hydrolyzing) n=1 Tax=viral metagenome TaxID=1070528 RepID=A0A6C0ER39_9ZZZZ